MKKQLRLVLVISILASFVAFLDSSVINVALPAITRELGGGLAAQQWVVDAYLLTLGAFILIAGSLSDLFGRKKIIKLGLIGFLVSSIACAIAPNINFLIISRAVQGLAGSLLVPSSLALIISTFKGEEQGKAIGSWTAWTGISFILGPLIGGILVDTASWRWVFGINVIPIAITLFLLKFIKLNEEPRKTKVDYIGAILCTIMLGGPVFSLIEQPRLGWDNPIIYSGIVSGIISAIIFYTYESRIPNPMLPFKLFRLRNFIVGNLATLAIYGSISIAIFTIVLFLQQVAGFSALYAGLSTMPVTIIMFFLSSKFGALAGKYGPRLFMGIGPIIAGFGFLTFLMVNENISYMTQILPGIIIFGIGLSVTVAPLTTAVLADISKDNAGIGSAINNAVARIAGLLAIAFIGVVIGTDAFSSGSKTVGIDAFHRSSIVMFSLLILGGVISAIGIKNKNLSVNTVK